jgi:hypothetical protein
MSTPTLTLDDQEADFIFAMAGKYKSKASWTTPEYRYKSGQGVPSEEVRSYLLGGGRQFFDESAKSAPDGSLDVYVWALCVAAEANERAMKNAAMARAIRSRVAKYDSKYVPMY